MLFIIKLTPDTLIFSNNYKFNKEVLSKKKIIRIKKIRK